MSNNNEVAFAGEAAREHLVGWGLWPVDGDGPYAAGVRDWWLRLLEKVTDAVGERDWHDEAYPEDKYTEITETAVEQMVAEARKARAVLRILDASDVGARFGPGDDEVEIRLVSALLDGDGTEGAYPYSEERTELLTLGSVTETYLTAAAMAVARAWRKLAVDTWYEANPEPDEDE